MSSFPEDSDQWGPWGGADEGPHTDESQQSPIRHFHRRYPIPEGPTGMAVPQQSQTMYVCPDGSVVSDPTQCQGAPTQAEGQNPNPTGLPTIAGLDLNNPLVMIGLLVLGYFVFVKGK